MRITKADDKCDSRLVRSPQNWPVRDRFFIGQQTSDKGNVFVQCLSQGAITFGQVGRSQLWKGNFPNTDEKASVFEKLA
ncbi:hypothetical protein [Nostoc commune]|uniref:hypothetical protein n=1 Tax=Nostoc commune TaxID=1178 RepID=UPI000D591967|nr:hypothetical protein [Nostoc commune]